MISENSFQKEWLLEMVGTYPRDPIIVEKVIRALVLLEALVKFELQFIFKGGTALMLMIQEPRRFSIDIDIIVAKETKGIEKILDKIVANTDFSKWDENKRTGTSTIQKRHFKLYYTSNGPSEGREHYILLDIVFSDNPYIHTQSIAISHFLLQETGNPLQVTAPTLPAILGDKLTAYGPNTTGVPFSKPMEVIKQIYDIAGIFDRLPNLDGVQENFLKSAETELTYRGMDPKNFQPIVDDILSTSHNYCTYGRTDQASFRIMQDGVGRLDSYIYGDKFREPQAQIAVSKATYIAKRIEKSLRDITRFDKAAKMADWVINDYSYTRLNKLKKHNLEAFHYWYQIFESS